MAGRDLTSEELQRLGALFGDSVDLRRVRITRDHPLSFYAPKTIGNTVHLRSDWGLFAGTGLDLSERGVSVLVHELVHVWQFQNGGLAYIPGSLLAQHRAYFDGSRHGFSWTTVSPACCRGRWNLAGEAGRRALVGRARAARRGRPAPRGRGAGRPTRSVHRSCAGVGVPRLRDLLSAADRSRGCSLEGFLDGAQQVPVRVPVRLPSSAAGPTPTSCSTPAG